MNFKELTRPILSWMFAGAFIYLTIIRLIPVEAFVGIATTVIIWWFKSRDTEKEIANLKKERDK